MPDAPPPPTPIHPEPEPNAPTVAPADAPADAPTNDTRALSALFVHLRLIIRVTFVAYALFLFTMTHWPALQILSVVTRPDLYIHFGAFGLWTFLLHASCWFGPIGTPRALRRGTLVAVAYALIDELTQGIPMLRRSVALDDAAANLGGVLLGTLAALILAWIVRPGKPGA